MWQRQQTVRARIQQYQRAPKSGVVQVESSSCATVKRCRKLIYTVKMNIFIQYESVDEYFKNCLTGKVNTHSVSVAAHRPRLRLSLSLSLFSLSLSVELSIDRSIVSVSVALSHSKTLTHALCWFLRSFAPVQTINRSTHCVSVYTMHVVCMCTHTHTIERENQRNQKYSENKG